MKKIIYALIAFSLIMPSVIYANTQPSAQNVTVNASGFNKNLSPSDTNQQLVDNVVDQLSTTGGGTPSSPVNSFQYNNAGNFAGGNMYQVGSNVGVGSTAPGTLLDVAGITRVQGFSLPSGASIGKVLTSDANGNGSWQATGGSGTVTSGTQNFFSVYTTNGPIVGNQGVLNLVGGNIGINVSNPTSSLQVSGTINGTLIQGAGAISGLTAGYIPQASTGTTLANTVMNQVGGNIGIGSASPGQNLDVQGTVRDLGEIISNFNGVLKATSGVVGQAVSGADYAPATSGTSILKGNGSGGFSNAVAGTDYQGPLTFSTGLTNTGGTVVVNNSQNIVQLSNLTSNGCVQTNSGNGTLSIVPCGGLGLWETNSVGIDTFQPYVGIGSTNPGQRLDVVGTVRAIGFSGSSAGGMTIASNQGIGLDGANSTYTNGALYISTGGNVGVGSTAPGTALDINGTARMTGFTLSMNPTAGYILTSNSVGVGTWTPAPTSGGIPGGSTPQLQYNSGGVFAGVTGSGIVNGNVGIGSIAPEYGLVVGSNGAKIVGIGPSNFTSNVGIGSTAAGQALDVQGTVRSTGFTMSKSSTTGYVLTASDSSGDAYWAAATGGSSGWTVSGNNVYNTSGGNVGIANTAPGVTLDVTGSIRGTQLVDTGVTSVVLVANSSHQVVAATNLTDTSYSTATGANPTGTIGLSAVNGSSNNFTRADGTASLSQSIVPTWTGLHTFNATPKAFVTGTGNVGIGSAAPGSLLDVYGTVRLGLGSGNNVGVGVNAPGQNLDVNGTVRSTGFTMSTAATAGYVLTASDSAGDAKWAAASGGNGTNFWVQGAGNVGIGTTLTNVGIGTLQTLNNSLTVLGNVSIGTQAGDTYLTTSGPNGGMIVEGNLGVGTFLASYPLQINGNVGIATTTPATSSNQQVTSQALILQSGWWNGSAAQPNNLGITFKADINNGNGVLHFYDTNDQGNALNDIMFDFVGTVLDARNKNDNAGALFGETYNTAYFGYGSLAGTNTWNLAMHNNDVCTVQESGNVSPICRNTIDDGTANKYSYFTGNVGIGTIAPGQALDVEGTLAYIHIEDTSGAYWHCKPAVSTGVFTCTAG